MNRTELRFDEGARLAFHVVGHNPRSVALVDLKLIARNYETIEEVDYVGGVRSVEVRTDVFLEVLGAPACFLRARFGKDRAAVLESIRSPVAHALETIRDWAPRAE